jgi:hypothetical protein
MKKFRQHWLPIGILVLISLMGFKEAFAYERVLFNEGVGYATSSAGTVEKMTSGNTTINGVYQIDCAKKGISEIASTTVSLYVDTSTRTGFNIMDGATGRKSDNSYTTAKDYSFTFTPPIWCEGSKVLLMGEPYVTRPVNWSIKGPTGNDSTVDAIPYAYCLGNDTGCTLSTVSGMDIAIIAVGSFSTSTGGGGSSGTTTEVSVSVVNDFSGLQIAITVLGALALWLGWTRFFMENFKRKSI